jgi:hypothetical protein
MLNHPTYEKLRTLRLSGMLQALHEQTQMPEIEALSFEERLGLLVDREATERENRRLQTRLRKAKLRQQASIEDLDFHTARGLDRALVLRLSSCQWVEARHNVLITGPTGVGNPRSAVRWPTRPACRATVPSTSDYLACWSSCTWPGLMAVTGKCSCACRRSMCSCSTIGA